MQAIGERSGPVFELIRSATERFFRGTERVVAVYYYFAICLPGTDRSHMLNNIVLDSYLNPSHRFDTNAPWSKLLDDYSPHERGWIDILLLMDEGRGQWVTAEGKPLYICSVD